MEIFVAIVIIGTLMLFTFALCKAMDRSPKKAVYRKTECKEALEKLRLLEAKEKGLIKEAALEASRVVAEAQKEEWLKNNKESWKIVVTKIDGTTKESSVFLNTAGISIYYGNFDPYYYVITDLAKQKAEDYAYHAWNGTFFKLGDTLINKDEISTIELVKVEV